MLRAYYKNLAAALLVVMSVGYLNLANAKPFLITYKGGMCPQNPGFGECKAVINFPFTDMATQVQLIGLNGQPLQQSIDYDCTPIDSYTSIQRLDGADLLYIGANNKSIIVYKVDDDLGGDSAVGLLDQSQIIDQNLNSVMTFRETVNPDSTTKYIFRTFIAAGQMQSSLYVPYITANPVSFEAPPVDGQKRNARGETEAQRKKRIFTPYVMTQWKMHKFRMWMLKVKEQSKKITGSYDGYIMSEMGDSDAGGTPEEEGWGWNLAGRNPFWWLTVKIKPWKNNIGLVPHVNYNIIRNNGTVALSGSFANGAEMSIDVSSLSPELYFITFSCNGNIFGVDKFVKVQQ